MTHRNPAAAQGPVQQHDQAAARQGSRHQQRDADPEAGEDRHQHGRRPRHAAAVAAREGGRRPHFDLRPEADHHAAGRSIAGFKLREGQAIGTKVTLRGDRMWEFFDRLLSVAIPRIRDFRGLPALSWDGRGNYTFGLNDQTVFPEINVDKIDTQRGMDITIVTTAMSDEGGKALLDAFGFPFKKGVEAEAPVDKRQRGRHRRGPVKSGAKKK